MPPTATASASRRRQRASAGELVRLLREDFTEHRLAIYASAVAFRALVSLIPLALLALGVLGALGRVDTWRNSIAPAIAPHVSRPVFHAIDYSALKILHSGTAGLIALSTALVVWDMGQAMSATIDALNRIHDVEETRSRLHRTAVAAGLALLGAAIFVGTVVVFAVAPRVQEGALHALLGLGRWLVAAVLLAFLVGMLFRYAPAEHREARWASAGSLLVIVVWLGATAAFWLWTTRVADFKSAIGSLTVLLLLTTYVLVSCAIFLVGAQLDELIRKNEGPRLADIVDAIVR
jgi:membrane protein